MISQQNILRIFSEPNLADFLRWLLGHLSIQTLAHFSINILIVTNLLRIYRKFSFKEIAVLFFWGCLY
jgi:hypothetical protein